MRRIATWTVAAALAVAGPAPTAAQPAGGQAATRTATEMVAAIERRLTAVANDMPADKYDFVPAGEGFRGVRNFGRQLKHAAAAQQLVAAVLLNEPVTGEMADEGRADPARSSDPDRRALVQPLRPGRAASAIQRARAAPNALSPEYARRGPLNQ
jgi:hypothetical protein